MGRNNLTIDSESAIIITESKLIEFVPYCDKDGVCEYKEFLQSLPEKDSAKLNSVVEKTETKGIDIAIKMKWVKKLEDNLYELRSKVGSNIQRALYFHKVDSKYIITHGFTKKTQKTPEGEKEKARNIRKKYMEEAKK